ncbi:MAG: hypothetical protein IT348_10450 [Candidatus Eisenbacteria bacterium]|nr:hypothetical protein [Candidatus Eisenbacteria bacterium]
MSVPAPTEIESLVRRVVLGAAAVAADHGAEPEARRNHAGLCYSLSHHVVADEMVCAEVVRAAIASVDDHRVVRNLLEAVVSMAPDQGRLVPPIRRLCEVAFDRGHDETLLVSLTWFARVARDGRDGDVPVEWFSAVGRVSSRRIPYLLREWVRRFSAGHPGLRALIREHEGCLLAKAMNTETVRAIHAAQPTVSGWLALVRDQEMAGEPLGLSFGDARAEAVDSLREARDGAADDAARERLSSWLAELEQS